MRVKELINILTTCDPDSMVTMANYEGGFDEVSNAQLVTLVLNVHTHEDFGAHERIEVLEEDEKINRKSVRAICIGKMEPSLISSSRRQSTAKFGLADRLVVLPIPRNDRGQGYNTDVPPGID